VQRFADIKMRGANVVERLYATRMPAPFLSILIEDCIVTGRDYNAGGARYNTTYIMPVGIGTLTDSLSSIRRHVFERGAVTMPQLAAALRNDFDGDEPLRQTLWQRTARYGNDDAEADAMLARVFDAVYDAVEGRLNTRGGRFHVNYLSTTCHVYFGSKVGATADGRRACEPLSEGISPVQGTDRMGPTAVVRSAARMDQAALVRTYFALGGHHLQFNVVTAETLRAAQASPESHRDLIVRVAGYSDYFCDLTRPLQDEIISRTEHQSF
jgi:formate C-acetyltransferase